MPCCLKDKPQENSWITTAINKIFAILLGSSVSSAITRIGIYDDSKLHDGFNFSCLNKVGVRMEKYQA